MVVFAVSPRGQWMCSNDASFAGVWFQLLVMFDVFLFAFGNPFLDDENTMFLIVLLLATS
jgi:hypothetical protein